MRWGLAILSETSSTSHIYIFVREVIEMGEAKHNPIAILAKEGRLPPKAKKKKLSSYELLARRTARQFDAYVTQYMGKW